MSVEMDWRRRIGTMFGRRSENGPCERGHWERGESMVFLAMVPFIETRRPKVHVVMLMSMEMSQW